MVCAVQETLSPDSCVKYWAILEVVDWTSPAERVLVERCREVARLTFERHVTAQRPLAEASEPILEALLRDDGLQVLPICYTLRN
jgi:hypothetical protein